jgi:hypothetical protein
VRAYQFGAHLRLQTASKYESFHGDFYELAMEEVFRVPAHTFKSAHRHNGKPMVPPSALEHQERWESAHGDNVPILTEEEIATLRRIR